uniref:Putative secreted protein n=1 Tax=Amblyomma cajennense TaxID=34607 RepID=A0A023FQL1_AMBCJ
MRETMFITFVAALGVFFSMGFGSPTLTQPASKCPAPNAEFNDGKGRKLIVPNRTENCTCDLGGGKSGKHTDGTPCSVRDGRSKIGTCLSGACIVNPGTFGCAGMRGTEENTIVHPNNCTFECKFENGTTQWAFSPDGSPCVNQDDGDEEQYRKNGTCKHRPGIEREDQNETTCIRNDQLHLLGC